MGGISGIGEELGSKDIKLGNRRENRRLEVIWKKHQWFTGKLVKLANELENYIIVAWLKEPDIEALLVTNSPVIRELPQQILQL